MEMISASEARVLATEVVSEAAQTQLRNIALAIKREAINGRHAALVNFYPLPVTENELKRLGYSVNKWDDQRDGAGMQVSW